MTRTIYLPGAIGIAIGFTASVLQTNWTTAFIATAVSAVVLAALLAARGWWLANRQVDQILDDELTPQPVDFAANLVPAEHQPALYDLTVHRTGTDLPPEVQRNISSFELTRQLLDRRVPSYLACEETGDTTVNGSHITWAPSTTGAQS